VPVEVQQRDSLGRALTGVAEGRGLVAPGEAMAALRDQDDRAAERRRGRMLAEQADRGAAGGHALFEGAHVADGVGATAAQARAERGLDARAQGLGLALGGGLLPGRRPQVAVVEHPAPGLLGRDQIARADAVAHLARALAEQAAGFRQRNLHRGTPSRIVIMVTKCHEGDVSPSWQSR
jgi:hypothetical protein